MLLFLLAASLVVASWLECPPSFGAETDRTGGDQVGPCDGGQLDQSSPIITEVRAGQRLKVSWPSNNLGGGIVRLALVPEAKADFHSAYDMAVLKSACYGHDQRAGRYNSSIAECNHPCNGRPGCHYQSVSDDLERYDTSIGIPTNLPDGIYVLQWKALIATNPLPYFSCAKLRITGGSAEQLCAPPIPRALDCRLADGGPKQNALIKNCLYGSFCFLGANRGIYSNDVDASIGFVEPVNKECDGRANCNNAKNKKKCEKELVTITPCPVSKAGFATNLRDSLELTSRRFRSTTVRRRRPILNLSSSDVLMRIPVGGHLRPGRRQRPQLQSSSINDESSLRADYRIGRRFTRRVRRSHWARLGRTGDSRPRRRRRQSISPTRRRCGSRCFRRLRNSNSSSDIRCGSRCFRRLRQNDGSSDMRCGSRCFRRIRHGRSRLGPRRARIIKSDSGESDVLRRFRVRIRRERRRRHQSSTSSDEEGSSWTSSTDTSLDYDTADSRDVLAIYGRNGRAIIAMPVETMTITTTEPTLLVGSVTVTASPTAQLTITRTQTISGTTVTQVETVPGGLTMTVTATETARFLGDLAEPEWEPMEAPIEELNPELPLIDENEMVDLESGM